MLKFHERDITIFPQNFLMFSIFIGNTQNNNMTQYTYLRSNQQVQVKMLHEMKNYVNGLSPLLIKIHFGHKYFIC